MARRNKSSNKIVPIVVLAAILAGGYYWYTSDGSSISDLHLPGMDATDSVGTADGEELVQESDPLISDNDILADSTSITDSQKETATEIPQAKVKNGYVDEYGNVIYTQPNGVSPITYKKASIGRWGYSIKYPTFLNKVNHSSDGSSFENNKGVKLSTYASWNVFNESIADLYRKDFPDVKSVTYKKLFKKQNTYVKSGYTKDNKIFYLKEAVFEKDDQEVVATLFFCYPKSFEKDASKVIKDVFGTFPQK